MKSWIIGFWRPMNAINITKKEIKISLAPDELVFISSAINETLEALEEWEFQTRTGRHRNEAIEMLAQVRDILKTCQNLDN